jgi:hypothetical protein
MRDIFSIVILALFTAGSAALGIVALIGLIVNSHPWYAYFTLALPAACTYMWLSFTRALIDHVREREEEEDDEI